LTAGSYLIKATWYL